MRNDCQVVVLFTLAVGCGSDPNHNVFPEGTASASETTAASDSATATVSDATSGSGSTPVTAGESASDAAESVSAASVSASDGGTSVGEGGASADGVLKYDVDPFDPGTGWDDVACQGGGDGYCTEKAPPDSFEAAVQWLFSAPGEPMSTITPLIANLTDDNADGRIDVCTDIPDLILVATLNMNVGGHIYVLDGETGTFHFMIANAVNPTTTPAVGDIDDDGLVEIVTSLRNDQIGYLAAFEHDGTLKWVSTDLWLDDYISAVALADLDNDGDVEIMAGASVHDHTGKRLWTAASGYIGTGLAIVNATAASDLDGDGDLEVVLGHSAYHHDGSQYYLAAGVSNGFPQIANLDADPDPEVLITNMNGLTMLEHTGQVKYQDLRPTGDPGGTSTTWIRPATVHDFDGNGVAEFASSSALNYTVYNGDASIVWKAFVQDGSGIAAGTAFDFLGDGKAEAMYADESTFYIYDDKGVPYLAVPRSSQTAIEYPTVADLDNDGSAEIAVVSMIGQGSPQSAPTVQVIRDKQDRWVKARRIWNQHTYHVTNVREDGSVPQFEKPSWKALNTFRTQAQIHDGGGTCQPPPAE